MTIKFIRDFLKLEAASGILLLGTLAIVLIIANTPLFPLYQKILTIPVHIRIGGLEVFKPLVLWVNDGLMAIFFMLLALEIKREVLEGELSSISKVTLPVAAALGGIIVPVLIYFLIIGDNTAYRPGWAITAATDIALVLGLLSLLGKRVPVNLKLFLVTLAIVDDIVAIVIIAVFYSSQIDLIPLVIAFGGLIILAFMCYKRVSNISGYMLIGLVIWVAVLKSGVHATLAGIAVGFCIPLISADIKTKSPLKALEHGLHPWVSFMIMPVFVFMNAGIPFQAVDGLNIVSPMPMGIALGLFLGKQIGVFSFTFIAVKLGLTSLPKGVNWLQIYGIAILAGIGFTMSLFVSSLAFDNPTLEIVSRQGILLGSFLSAVIGMLLLYYATKNQKNI